MRSSNFNREVGTVAVGNHVLTGTHSGPRVMPNVVGGEPFTILAWEEWMQRAHCLDVDPDIFFPDQAGRHSGIAAKKICRGCPVREACLAHALKTHESSGIWGGLSTRERYDLKRRVS